MKEMIEKNVGGGEGTPKDPEKEENRKKPSVTAIYPSLEDDSGKTKKERRS